VREIVKIAEPSAVNRSRDVQNMKYDAGGTERLVVVKVLTSFDNDNEIR
jgi:hypothetical protein